MNTSLENKKHVRNQATQLYGYCKWSLIEVACSLNSEFC